VCVCVCVCIRAYFTPLYMHVMCCSQDLSIWRSQTHQADFYRDYAQKIAEVIVMEGEVGKLREVRMYVCVCVCLYISRECTV
jgi:hypothetical protein